MKYDAFDKDGKLKKFSNLPLSHQTAYLVGGLVMVAIFSWLFIAGS